MKEQRVKAGDHVSVTLGRGEVAAFVLATFRVGSIEYSTLCIPTQGVEHTSISECEDRFTVRSDGLRLLVQT
jgi:hypothetical protein